MAKRGYKLQEFVAHSVNVNCLTIGKKACRLFVTGGDDHEVNLWSIGKPTSLMNLCSHTAPVECVAFDSAEVLVLGGASTGAIKLWDLEGAKMICTLTGHRSNCSAVEFHPFGEYFASGSMDTNLKIWDIRKKGCIHTYKGHTQGISTIRFTPDGRWVVSGGFDNVVKVWDLTAGKLLHDFKIHEGHIRSIDFHPLEFLLATGSADRTVKFWDLETFELIGSSRPEVSEDSGVRAITFHPDGRTVFCGFDDSLKVYSWEPVICHDAVDMGWSALGDLCINDGKILGCSLYQNSVGVWVADVSRIDPYRVGIPEQSVCSEKKFNPLGSLALEKVGIGVRSTSGFRSTSPDCDLKEIKTIYVDSTGGNPITSQKIGFSNSPKVILPLDCEEISDPQSEKRSPSMGVLEKSNGLSFNKSFFVPSIAPQESPAGKDSPISGTDSITFSRTEPCMLLRPAHVQRPSSTKYDAERLFTAVEAGSFNNMKSELNGSVYPNSQPKLISSDGAVQTSKEKNSQIKSVTEKMLSPSHVRRLSNSKFDAERLSMAVESGILNNMKSELDSAKDPNSQTKLISSDETIKTSEEKNPQVKSVTDKMLRPSHVRGPSNSKFDVERLSMAVESGSFNNMKSELDSARDPNSQTLLVPSDGAVKPCEENNSHIKSVTEKIEKKLSPQRPPNQETCDESLNCNQGINSVKFVNGVAVIPGRTRTLVERFEGREKFNSNEDQAANITPQTGLRSNEDQATNVNAHMRLNSNEDRVNRTTPHTRLNSSESQNITAHVRTSGSEDQATNMPPCMRLSCCDEEATNASPCDEQATNTPPCMRQSNSKDQATNTPPCMRLSRSEDQATNMPPCMKFSRNGDQTTNNTPDMRLSSNKDHAATTVTRVRFKNNADQATTTTTRVRFKNNADQATTTTTRVRFKNNADQATIKTTCVRYRNNPRQVMTTATHLHYKNDEDQATINTPHVIVEADEQPTILKEEPQISGRDMTSANAGQVIENLMQTHDLFISTLQSRLTKLQVVRHFWERKDIKGAINALRKLPDHSVGIHGAINALRKLPDHSVQADMISVLMEKMEILNLDLFSCLLPVLVGLLDSKIERHASISLEMLLKLVVVFSPVIRSTVSAPPAVGVDLHAEQRRECCNQCFVQLQKIQKILPVLVRRGGSLAKGALELNLVLEES